MRIYIRAIFILLLFVVLISPSNVLATEAPEVYPIGIVIDIHPCSAADVSENYYYVDIVVPREEVLELMVTPTATYRYPDDLLNSEYGSSENDWVSVLLFLDYIDWMSRECRSNFYFDSFDVDQIPFDKYKVVIYEEDHDLVESPIYRSSESATYDQPFGYKTFYNPDSQTFSREYYEAETFTGGNHFGNGLIYFVIGVFVVLISAFVLMESFIYLVARQGWRAVLITLGFNAIVFIIVLLQGADVFREYSIWFMMFGLLFVPGIYTGKILLLKKYAPLAFKVGIFISVVYYIVYFIYTAMLLA